MDSLACLLDRGRACHVRWHGQDRAAFTSREGRGSFAQSFLVAGDGTDTDSLLLKRLGYRVSDAAARSGDQTERLRTPSTRVRVAVSPERPGSRRQNNRGPPCGEMGAACELK
jgi:hypothetical protein